MASSACGGGEVAAMRSITATLSDWGIFGVAIGGAAYYVLRMMISPALQRKQAWRTWTFESPHWRMTPDRYPGNWRSSYSSRRGWNQLFAAFPNKLKEVRT